MKPSTRRVIASTLLLAFTARALIPEGFMPATDRPFSFQICWEGFPAGMLAHRGPAHADAMSVGSMPDMDMDADSMPGMPADSRPTGSAPAHPRGAHHPPGSPSHSEHCVFGTACSAGPIPFLPLPSALSFTRQLRAVTFASSALAVRLVHLPQPRAPPVS
ncbi:MAG TPA: hypothetical protein VMD49_00235 [Steroidobacteraceae bacterium]|nr:hypothetical protein [Steroidobacteraceae bacterium]